MEENPYMAIVSALTEGSAPASVAAGPVVYGHVKSAPTPESPDRMLVVTVGSLDKGPNALLKNAGMGEFAAGDRLLMLPIEEAQRYIILCKVVDV